MNQLHEIQMLILRELLYNPEAHFTDLNISGMTNDHFSYHINVLVDNGYVLKEGSKYKLTLKGKEFANTMDTVQIEIEKQPKSSVLVTTVKEEKGEEYILMSKRKKDPFIGCRGFTTGKIRFGETVVDAAKRELSEETGLEADFEHTGIVVHELVYNREGKLFEDKYFHIVGAVNPTGELKNTKDAENRWEKRKDFKKIKNKFYSEEDIYDVFCKGQKGFFEMKFVLDV